jgi:hypothetical protein
MFSIVDGMTSWRRQRIAERAHALWEEKGRPHGDDLAHWFRAERETPVRITFDSNAWERVFDPNDTEYVSIRAALADGRIEGFISEAGFRIEAIRRSERASYFGQPRMDMRLSVVLRNGVPHLCMSFGPDDKRHPGLPAIQSSKLQSALTAGIRVIRTLSWMGLPSPSPALDPTIFAQESKEAARDREQRQSNVSAGITGRGVGRAAFDTAGGWNLPPGGPQSERRFRNACAEWADGELVAAHIAYRNDIVCTDDHAGGAGTSIFDQGNRSWLGMHYGVAFMTLNELMARLCG